MVAPAYTEDTYVDHALSANLDSTFAFEGPEKLLELWFWASPADVPAPLAREGLRAIPLEKWKAILDLVSCKILSMKSSASVDAYLLSESSLFVFPHKLVLKTCGTTTTLACLDEIFATARAELGRSSSVALDSKAIHKVFYSRRSFMFPEKQKHVHTDWKREVQLLNEHFVSGKSYVVGDFTSDDHWYLYMGGDGSPKSVPGFSQDETFEMLMTRLDCKQMEQFVTTRKPGEQPAADDAEDSGHADGETTFFASRLASVFDEGPSSDTPQSASANPFPSPQLSDTMELSDAEDVAEHSAPEFINDAFAFTPCGFSSNSIAKGPEGYYYTLHITPEAGWSYASFETNFAFSSNPNINIVDVMVRVLRIFVPGKFSVTLFTDSNNGNGNATLQKLADSESALQKLGYAKHEKIIYDLKGDYNLLYLNFEKL